MKILLLTKRQYTAKDLIDDEFGRLWQLPYHWALHGHAVKALCLSYTQKPEGPVKKLETNSAGSIEWLSLNSGTARVSGLGRYFKQARDLAASFKPDVVIASSDTFYVVLGQRIAATCGAVFVAELYDDYEVFAAARIPGVKSLYRRALLRADLVVTISAPLKRHVETSGVNEDAVLVVENAIDKSAFYARDKSASRQQFHIPQDGTVIGTAGALSTTRGIETFYEAFFALARENENLFAAVAGPRDVPVPPHPRLIDAGHLPWQDVPIFLNALDIGVVCNKHSLFARHCFPQKAYEMLACGLSVVGADVGVMADLLCDLPDYLFKPGDPTSLAHSLRHAIDARARPDKTIPTWEHLATRAEEAIAQKIARISHN